MAAHLLGDDVAVLVALDDAAAVFDREFSAHSFACVRWRDCEGRDGLGALAAALTQKGNGKRAGDVLEG